jgi:4'-phosphopantetheinyl transferase
MMAVSSSIRQFSWSSTPSVLALPAEQVDVWEMCLDGRAMSDFDGSILSPDEIARARRFHFERDCLRFIHCRSALRSLLAAYLKIPAAEICFEYLKSGKPRLAAEQNSQALEFNVSHSAEMALIAICDEHQIGVDIEKIRDEIDATALANRFFSSRERAALRALPEDRRVTGFFACWTRKEAFLKAVGDGLSFPLTDFSVTTDPDLGPQLIEIKGKSEAGNQWLLADLAVPEGYRATVALNNRDLRMESNIAH